MGVVGVEALLRCQHPLKGMVPPGEFIPLMEGTASMSDVTRHVLGLALDQCAAWKRDGMSLSVAVNLSMYSLVDPDLIADVRGHLERPAVQPQRPALEIAESAARSDPIMSLRTLRSLSASGVLLSIDDYGTGYSSLAYLQDMPAEELKLDKSFITNVVRHATSAAIVTPRFASPVGCAWALSPKVSRTRRPSPHCGRCIASPRRETGRRRRWMHWPCLPSSRK